MDQIVATYDKLLKLGVNIFIHQTETVMPLFEFGMRRVILNNRSDSKYWLQYHTDLSYKR